MYHRGNPYNLRRVSLFGLMSGCFVVLMSLVAVACFVLAGWRRAQLCVSACHISTGYAHPQTAFCARTAATPDQQHLLPRQAF